MCMGPGQELQLYSDNQHADPVMATIIATIVQSCKLMVETKVNICACLVMVVEIACPCQSTVVN